MSKFYLDLITYRLNHRICSLKTAFILTTIDIDTWEMIVTVSSTNILPNLGKLLMDLQKPDKIWPNICWGNCHYHLSIVCICRSKNESGFHPVHRSGKPWCIALSYILSGFTLQSAQLAWATFYDSDGILLNREMEFAHWKPLSFLLRQIQTIERW